MGMSRVARRVLVGSVSLAMVVAGLQALPVWAAPAPSPEGPGSSSSTVPAGVVDGVFPFLWTVFRLRVRVWFCGLVRILLV